MFFYREKVTRFVVLRKQIRVILLHPRNTSEALIMCSDEHYNFSEMTQNLPHRSVKVNIQ